MTTSSGARLAFFAKRSRFRTGLMYFWAANAASAALVTRWASFPAILRVHVRILPPDSGPERGSGVGSVFWLAHPALPLLANKRVGIPFFVFHVKHVPNRTPLICR